jgi:16S rRNA (guanine1516-N2)-methyltransferase
MNTVISFSGDKQSLQSKAKQLSASSGLSVVAYAEAKQADVILLYTDNGLELHNLQHVQGKLFIDFLAPGLSYRKQYGGGTKEPLARAVGVKANTRPTILDTTAGLGIDSFILADLGCQVRMIERSPLLAALLQDGLTRAGIQNPVLLQGDSTRLITQPENLSDTIYLDPMYPHRKKSALNKQDMRIIRELVGDDNDVESVFYAAIKYALKRVVVKRPKGAPLMAGESPSHIIQMKNSRYDVYMVKQQ